MQQGTPLLTSRTHTLHCWNVEFRRKHSRTQVYGKPESIGLRLSHRYSWPCIFLRPSNPGEGSLRSTVNHPSMHAWPVTSVQLWPCGTVAPAVCETRDVSNSTHHTHMWLFQHLAKMWTAQHSHNMVNWQPAALRRVDKGGVLALRTHCALLSDQLPRRAPEHTPFKHS